MKSENGGDNSYEGICNPRGISCVNRGRQLELVKEILGTLCVEFKWNMAIVSDNSKNFMERGYKNSWHVTLRLSVRPQLSRQTDSRNVWTTGQFP